MKLGHLLVVTILASMATAAAAQVVYQPVRYQYGKYNEVYYGGTNPGFTNNANVYLPPALLSAYAVERISTPPSQNPYTPYGPGSPFFSPYSNDATNSASIYTPFIFTDYLPYQEAGQFGFTPDDARNEAYANVPLIQTGFNFGAPVVEEKETAPEPVAVAVRPIDPRDKAIPLLNWAKVERTHNPDLFKAIMDEARKCDPVATVAVEQSFASEK